MSTDFSRAFDSIPRCDLCGEDIEDDSLLVEREDGQYHRECWEAENGPPDDPDAWSGGFAENH